MKKYNKSYCFGFKSNECGYPFKVSKNFKIVRSDDDKIVVIGSANDIMKVIRDIEWQGYYPEVLGWRVNGVDINRYTFRSNKLYSVTYDPEWDGYYSVCPVQEISGKQKTCNYKGGYR